MTIRPYYSLLERIDGQWTVQFGDYSRAVVTQERRDMHESHPYPRLKDLRIVEGYETDTRAVTIAKACEVAL